MLTKRIIPCLDVKDFRTVKGVHFQNLRDAGNAVELAQFYSEQGADELTFLDISATQEGRKTFVDFVEEVARQISIPFTVGGGISEISDMKKLFDAGADKISINSAAVKNPELIARAAESFGSQAVVVAADVKKTNNGWRIFTRGGTYDTGLNAVDWLKKAQYLGAGEFLITSMDHDGTKSGFDIKFLETIKNFVRLPVIASGGAGKKEDFLEIFSRNLAEAGLAASIFHFGEIPIPELKYFLEANGIPVRR